MDEHIHRVEIFWLLIVVQLHLMVLHLSLALVLSYLELKTVEELRSDCSILDVGFWNEADKEHQGLVELSLPTHDVQNLLHV